MIQWDGENHMVMDDLYESDEARQQRESRMEAEWEHADDGLDELGCEPDTSGQEGGHDEVPF